MGQTQTTSKAEVYYDDLKQWHQDFERLNLKVTKTIKNQAMSRDVYKLVNSDPVLLRICDQKTKKPLNHLNKLFLFIVENRQKLKTALCSIEGDNIVISEKITQEITNFLKEFYVFFTDSSFRIEMKSSTRNVIYFVENEDTISKSAVGVCSVTGCVSRGQRGKDEYIVLCDSNTNIKTTLLGVSEREVESLRKFVNLKSILKVVISELLQSNETASDAIDTSSLSKQIEHLSIDENSPRSADKKAQDSGSAKPGSRPKCAAPSSYTTKHFHESDKDKTTHKTDLKVLGFSAVHIEDIQEQICTCGLGDIGSEENYIASEDRDINTISHNNEKAQYRCVSNYSHNTANCQEDQVTIALLEGQITRFSERLKQAIIEKDKIEKSNEELTDEVKLLKEIGYKHDGLVNDSAKHHSQASQPIQDTRHEEVRLSGTSQENQTATVHSYNGKTAQEVQIKSLALQAQVSKKEEELQLALQKSKQKEMKLNEELQKLRLEKDNLAALHKQLELECQNTKDDLDKSQNENAELRERDHMVENVQTANENLNVQLNDLRSSNTHLNKQLKESEKMVSDQNDIVANLQQVNGSLNTRIERNEAELKQKTREIEEIKRKFDSMKKTVSGVQQAYCDINDQVTSLTIECQKKDSTIRQHREQIQELTLRLASEMNTKISRSETSLENISIACRPMTITDEYQHLCSNTWLEAKQALDEMNWEHEKAIEFLCDILMLSLQPAQTYFQMTMSDLSELLRRPLQGVGQSGKSMSDGDNPWPSLDVVTVVGDHFRRHAVRVQTEPLIKKALELLKEKHQALMTCDVQENKAITSYIEESCRMGWKMVIQRPPMDFVTKDINKPFKGEKEHPLAWGSRPSTTSIVRIYQYPSLLHGKQTMVKGKVLVH